MARNRKLSAGDLARVIAELKAQLPDGYDPYTDYWAAPYDCDCCLSALAEGVDPTDLGLPEAIRPRRPAASFWDRRAS